MPSTVVSDTDLTDAATSSQVVTIAGHADVALQLIEQSGRNGASFDAVVWRDLLSSYDAQLEAQLLNGSGGIGPAAQLNGLMTASGTGAIAYTSGSPTASLLFLPLGQAYGYVSDNRRIHPEAWLCRGGRWAWIETSEDTAGRPLGVPMTAGSIVANPAQPDPIGGLIGQPVFGAEAIPTTLGTGGNQDAIIACRPSDMLLFEGAPTVHVFDEVLSGALQGRVQLRCYVAAITGRYSSSIAVVTGTGLVVPTNE